MGALKGSHISNLCLTVTTGQSSHPSALREAVELSRSRLSPFHVPTRFTEKTVPAFAGLLLGIPLPTPAFSTQATDLMGYFKPGFDEEGQLGTQVISL